MSHCHDLISFADGELEPSRADAFREHLRTCDACQAGLVEALQLSARLSTLPKDRIRMPTSVVAVFVHAIARHWKRIVQWGSGVLVTSGVAALALIRFCSPTHVFAEQTTRPGVIRFAYPGAADYRPTRDVMLGAAGTTDPVQRIPYSALSELESRGDKRGVAVAQAWNGEKLADVVKQLSALPQTDAIRSDLAAVEVMSQTSNLQPVLAELESLRQSKDPAAARAARWNHALVLSRLELPLSAAAAFREIASEHEPGWAEEASRRADTEQQRAHDFKATWQRADEAGRNLLQGGPPVVGELVALRPGLLRAYFYNAVRTAPGRARVLDLAAMAAELDAKDDPQHHILRGYVQRVAKLDFGRREPFARAYADLLANKPVPEDIATRLLTETDSEELADIVMGAMVEREVVPDHLDWFLRMARRAGDPWFEIVHTRATADAKLKAGNLAAAEAVLSAGAKQCRPAFSYQCLTLERRLGKLYSDTDRIHDAQTVLQTALHTARSAGEWERYRALLSQLSDVERFHGATAMLRAYATEVVLMGDPKNASRDCGYRGTTYRILAGASILDLDGREARRYLTESLPCSQRMLAPALLLADIGRLDPQPGDLAQLRSLLGDARATGLNPADQILADETEGRLLIEHDRSAGAALLHQAVAAADKMAGDPIARKARTAAYAVLALDAAHASDHARALSLIAEDLGLPAPGPCTVGIVAEDDRMAVVVRRPDGEDRGEYRTRRRPSEGSVTVPADLVRGLTACPHVRVMATAAVQGQARVLPSGLAWSYAGGVRDAAPAARAAAEPRALVVTGVKPPESLALDSVTIPASETGPATMLSGLEATPSRVTAAMRDATEIQFHLHALMNVKVSDASHLVLSPEPSSGRYALTAEDIRKVELRGRPLVVLGACHSARGARYQHRVWSLPDAFLAAGARAVFATATEIPATESGRFFAAVLAKVRTGVAPAVALRDLRIEHLPAQDWVQDVILFE